MDLSTTIAPKSDQLNAEDFLSGPATITVTDVTAGNTEQPVNIVTAEYGPRRPYRPGKSMRRVIVAAWGVDSADYIGRRMTIFRDPDVKFGGQDVGGIRISHMSHIDRRLTLPLTVTRGRRAPYVVDPLPVDAIQSKIPVDIEARIEAMADPDKLTAMIDWLGKLAGEDEQRIRDLVELVEKRIVAIEGPPPSADAAQQTIQQELGAEEVQS